MRASCADVTRQENRLTSDNKSRYSYQRDSASPRLARLHGKLARRVQRLVCKAAGRSLKISGGIPQRIDLIGLFCTQLGQGKSIAYSLFKENSRLGIHATQYIIQINC